MKTLKTIALLFLLTLTINAQTFQASGDNRNQATFESNAPLEDIVGLSNEVEAVAMINPADLSHAMGKVSVNLNVLKTGIDLRDEHLRGEMWLNTTKFPSAEFKLKSISGASSLTDSKATDVKLHGAFTVHGVTKEIVVDAQLTYFKESAATKGKMAGNLLKVKANFEIKLGDYGVMITKMVVGKLDENIKVSIAFISTDAGSKMAGNPCGANPCSPDMHKDGNKDSHKMDKGACNPCSSK
jgi:polyisoprenoid-binding protein YceI